MYFDERKKKRLGACGRLLLLAVLGLSAGAEAAEYFVDQVKGDDSFLGLSREPGAQKEGPLKTITRAAHLAGPGDTVRVIPSGGDYRQTVDLYKMRDGEPGKPITIDGGGVWLNGADPCPAEGWQDAGGGLWSLTGMNFSEMLVIDGKLSFSTMEYDLLVPGEFCYMPNSFNRLFYRQVGKEVPVVEVEQKGTMVALDPAAWQHSGMSGILRYNGLTRPGTVRNEGKDIPLVQAKDRLKSGQFCVADKVLYIRPPQGIHPSALRIEAVVRMNGVQLGGATKQVIVRNFNVRHVFNDAFNVHGEVKEISFYNCNAEDCGDEGFSSHGTCQTLLDGATFLRCDNGINNVNKTVSVSRNILSAFMRHNGYECQQESEHTLENAILIDNPNQLTGKGKKLVVDNVLILRTPQGPAKTVAISAEVDDMVLRRITAAGNTALIFNTTGKPMTLENCWFGGNQGSIYIRLDNPLSAMLWRDVTLGAGLQVSGRVGKPLAFESWLAEGGASLSANGVRIDAALSLAALWQGALPALPAPEQARGCSLALYQRYLAFCRSPRVSE